MNLQHSHLHIMHLGQSHTSSVRHMRRLTPPMCLTASPEAMLWQYNDAWKHADYMSDNPPEDPVYCPISV